MVCKCFQITRNFYYKVESEMGIMQTFACLTDKRAVKATLQDQTRVLEAQSSLG
jgi:hypothetical protein